MKQGFRALDPSDKIWPHTMNLLLSGTPGGVGPTIQIAGRGPNAHRTHLLAVELGKAGLVQKMPVNAPTFVAMHVYLGPICR